MAKQLSKTGIETGLDIEAHHVTQSVDAFTGIDAYDVTLSGSLTHTGSMDMDGRLIVTSSAGPLDQKYYSFTNADGLLEATPFLQRFIFAADGIPNQSFGIQQGGTYTQMVASGFNRPDTGESSNFLITPTQVMMASGSEDIVFTGISNFYGEMPNMKFLQTVDTAGTLPTNNSIQSTGSWEHTGSATFVNSITGSSPLATLYGPNKMELLSIGEMKLRTNGGLFPNIIVDSGRSILNYVQTGSGQFVISDQNINNHLVISPTQTPSFTAGYGGLEFYTTQAVTGIITLSSSADIILDADGSQIYMKDGGVDRLTFNLDSTPELDVVGDFTIDSSGDITLDAAGDQIYMKNGGTDRLTFNLDTSPEIVANGNLNITGSSVTINDVKRRIYTLTTTDNSIQQIFIQVGINQAKYIKAIVLGYATSANANNAGSVGGEFVKFFDNQAGTATALSNSTGTLANNIGAGTPNFAIFDEGQLRITGINGVTIDWKIILEEVQVS